MKRHSGYDEGMPVFEPHAKLDTLYHFFFELYLRGNHVEGGRKSYAGVIGLILAWEEKKG